MPVRSKECRQCGTEIREDMSRCPKCGADVTAPQQPEASIQSGNSPAPGAVGKTVPPS